MNSNQETVHTYKVTRSLTSIFFVPIAVFFSIQIIIMIIGIGQVIKGWDQGLTKMCVGEKRKLTIPANMGYGSRAMGSAIPANSALVFDVELLRINGKDEL